MAEALNSTTKMSYILVQFTLNGTQYRFTNWGTTVDPGGANWLSVPAMEVKWPQNTGTLGSSTCIITIQRDANSTISALSDILVSDGTPTAPVMLEVREVVLPVVTGDTASETIPFRGEVMRVIANAGGRAKQIRFEAEPQKSRLEIPLGLPCNHHCPWQFMGKGCSLQGGASPRGPQFAAIAHNRTISAIDGKVVTLSTDPSLTGDRSLRFGYLAYNDVRIGIWDWDPVEPRRVILRQQPPASWFGQLVQVVPGCNKTITDCRNWNNELNFGGIGFAIPAYNPHYEAGDS